MYSQVQTIVAKFVSVNWVESAMCHAGSKNIEVATEAVLSSKNLFDVGCGGSTLQLTAKPGQQLNVSIVDFTWQAAIDQAGSCVNYLELHDTTGDDRVTVCAGPSRERDIMMSAANVLQAHFQLQDPKQQHFLLEIRGQAWQITFVVKIMFVLKYTDMIVVFTCVVQFKLTHVYLQSYLHP